MLNTERLTLIYAERLMLNAKRFQHYVINLPNLLVLQAWAMIKSVHAWQLH